MPRAPKKTKPPPKTLHVYHLVSRQGDPLAVVLENREEGHLEIFIVPAFDSPGALSQAIRNSYEAAGGKELIQDTSEMLDVDTPDFTPEWFEKWRATVLAQLGGHMFPAPTNPDPKTLN
jgi:hypothetical protein